MSLVAAGGLLAFSACSDDFKAPDLTPDGSTGITLQIPNPDGAAQFAKTRAENLDTRSDESAAEGAIVGQDFWLLAYGSGDNVVRKHLTESQLQTLSNDYKTTRVDLVPDTYRFYVVGNLQKYAPAGTDFNTISEDALKNLVLNFDASSNILTPSNGLPMVCLNTEIKKGDGSIVANGEYEIGAGVVPTIKADMSFLCSKVRYTILFDNAEGGISNANFGPANFLDFEGASAKNLVVSTNLIKAASSPVGLYDLGSINLNKVENPSTWTDYGKAETEITANLASANFSNKAGKRTWQGVIYVPENLNSEDAKRTTLYFDGKVNEDFSNPYSLVLNKERTDNGDDKVNRSKFYDIVASAKSRDAFDINSISVHDWTTQNLVYNLHGQYFLHIDQTKIELQGGNDVSIWYESDTQISTISPKYNGKDLYKFVVEDNELKVSVNPEISLDDYASINSNLSTYNFFHIQAGTLVKKIDVDLKLEAFINVDPLELTLNVRELKASGDYSGKFPVTVETNISQITVSRVQSDLWTKADSQGVLKLTIDNDDLTFDSPISISGTSIINIDYSGLNSTHDFWKTKGEFAFEVSGKVGSETITKRVIIKIEPAIDDYVIHLRADGWSNPHIYVYQCLELPADFWGIVNGEPLASKPIGYGDNKYNGSTFAPQYFAALEYSFTGKIAFKGWNEPVNKESLNSWDSGDWKYGSEYNGFFLFKNSYAKPDAICEWNASVSDSDKRYNKNLDFCSDQRSNGCASCGNNDYNRLWPGVRMAKSTASDGTTWYTFRLTGVATPGKALIMFTDGHSYSSGQNRYPGEAEVGVPLFDFPNREGWFNVADSKKEFKSTGPSMGGSSIIDPTPTTNTYRVWFIWHNYDKLDGLNLWNNSEKFFVGNENFDYNNKTEQATKNGTYHKGEVKDGKKWAYLEFTTNNLPNSLGWGSVNDDWGSSIEKSKFSTSGDVYIDADNSIKSGKPY